MLGIGALFLLFVLSYSQRVASQSCETLGELLHHCPRMDKLLTHFLTIQTFYGTGEGTVLKSFRDSIEPQVNVYLLNFAVMCTFKEAGNSFQYFSNSYTLRDEYCHCLTSDATIMVSCKFLKISKI